MIAAEKDENVSQYTHNKYMPRTTLRPRFTSLSRKEIQLLFRHARSLFNNEVIDMRVTKGTKSSAGKLLIIIPKKVGNAPYRNYLRRCSKEVFYQEELHTKPFGWTIRFKPSPKKITFGELLLCWQNACAPFSQKASQ